VTTVGQELAARRATFWIAVGGVALLSQFAARVLADRVGDQVPALRTFVNYLNRSEGS
jgi:hypothetical protein